MLPLTRAAADAGHDVVFVTGADAVRYAASPGVEVCAVDSGERSDGLARYLGQFPRAELEKLTPDQRFAHMFAHYMVGIGAADRLEDMLTFVRGRRPDLIVTSAAERAAMLAAIILGVPFAVHGISSPKSATVMEAAWNVTGEIARQHGVEALPDRTAIPYVDIWPQRLAPRDVSAEFPLRVPMQTVPRTGGARSPVLDGLPFERTAYITAGTSHNQRPGFLEAMIDAFRDTRINAVATVGRDVDPARFGATPAHIRIEQFVPQEQLLPHVDLVVCHAGAGTILGALTHAVPLVVSPLATDQFEMAAQVAAAEAGLVATADRESIAAAVRAVCENPAYRVCAQVLSSEITELSTPAEVLDRLL